MTVSRFDQILPPDVVALVDFFASDRRPTCVLRPHLQLSNDSHIVFVNPALDRFLESQDHNTFVSWIQALLGTARHDGNVQQVRYMEQEWSYKKIRSCDCIVLHLEQSTDVADVGGKKTENKGAKAQGSIADNNYSNIDETTWVVDWTRFSCAAVTSWTQRLRDLAWEDTDIGPMETWPLFLRQNVVALMATPSPRAIHWGKTGVAFFNEAVRPILGDRADELMGNGIKGIFEDDQVDLHTLVLGDAFRSGKTDTRHRATYTYMRHGILQDRYLDISTMPICGSDGRLCGKSFDFVEVTDTVLEERRNKLTSDLLERFNTVKSWDQLWSALRKIFEDAQAYLPYASIYTTTNDDSDNAVSEQTETHHVYKLKAVIGAKSKQVPSILSSLPGSKTAQAARMISEASNSIEIKVLRLEDSKFPPELAIELQDGRMADTGFVLSVQDIGKTHVAGCIVVGFNSRHPFGTEDVDLMKFVQSTISRFVTTLLHPIIEATALGIPMPGNLAFAELRLLMADRKTNAFVNLARNAPCGMFIVNLDGSPRFLNDKYFELTGFTSLEQVTEISRTRSFWSDVLSEEDARRQATTTGDSHFAQQLVQAGSMQSEHRLLFPPDPANSNAPRVFNRWIDCVTFPDLGPENNIQALMGFITDITDRKRAEEVQVEREKEAQAEKLRTVLANKLAADDFIDTVSHELRNPLSAIFQSADGIIATTESILPNSVTDAIRSIVDATETIILCTQHMKTIVDDVLTLSKLDSNLLTLSLHEACPADLAAQALKFCEAECRTMQISSSIHIADSYYAHNAEHVMLDGSRTLQILLNLLSNAIKFTKMARTKTITINLTAFTTQQDHESSDLTFAKTEPTVCARPSLPAATISELPSHNKTPQDDLYVQFAVTDTGGGIAQKEIARLFKKFSQGSAKTYTQYGGSGLGLFISKRLTELHGGRIGVKSGGPGCGATFAFYIRVKQAKPSLIRNRLSSTSFPFELSIGRRSSTGTDQRDCEPRTKNVTKHFDILIVEDNLVNQKVMAKQLRQLGHTVHVANHGVEALNFLAKTQCRCRDTAKTTCMGATNGVPLSIILMDIEMPVMDGLTCTRKVRELENTSEIVHHVPIIAITANAREEQIEQARNSGVDDVVTKPYRLPMLVAAIERLMEERSTRT